MPGGGRREHVYGRRAVEEALRGRRRVHRVLRQPQTPAADLERLAGSPDHQGVVAEADPYPYAGAGELLSAAGGLLLGLDQVQDPQNLGAICRSAEAAGCAGVVLPERRAAAVTPAVCKASAGAVEHLRIARVRNLADWLGEARDAGFWVWGADADAEAAYAEVDLTAPLVLVLGAEGTGLRPRVAAACDGLLRIPLRGRVASLNVAAAAAVLLFEALRQRDPAP